jgi:sterol 3beta-glucosyltransferase
VLLLASGTRGDVQPFLALALGLQDAGVPSVIAAAPRFRTLVEGRGVGFAALRGNPSDLMAAGSGSMAASVSRGIARGAVSTARFLRAAQDEYRLMLESAAEAGRPARAIIAGLSSTWGLSIAEAFHVPCVLCMLQPFGRTREFPSALLPFRFSLGGTYNALTYRALEQAMWQPWRRTTNAWRRGLRLPPLPLAGPWRAMYASGLQCLYGFSPEVAPPPGDWPDRHAVTGYWFLDGTHGWSAPPALEGFLSSGPPPIFVGFGSMEMGGGNGLARAIEAALALTGLRAVVSTGGSDASLLLVDGARRTIVPGDVPHAWLFPRVSAVVHHGGAGTTAEGVRAGVPSIIFPGAADQYFWAERIADLGAGLRAATGSHAPRTIAALLVRASTDQGMRRRAQALGEKVRAERGVARAVEALVSILGSTA